MTTKDPLREGLERLANSFEATGDRHMSHTNVAQSIRSAIALADTAPAEEGLPKTPDLTPQRRGWENGTLIRFFENLPTGEAARWAPDYILAITSAMLMVREMPTPLPGRNHQPRQFAKGGILLCDNSPNLGVKEVRVESWECIIDPYDTCRRGEDPKHDPENAPPTNRFWTCARLEATDGTGIA